jgi:ribonuclease P protein component
MKILFTDLYRFARIEIDCVFKVVELAGKTIHFKLLRSQIPTSHGKLLIITPRHAGKSCIRNLVRRRIKTIYYTEKLYLLSNVFVILVYKGAETTPYEDLKQFLVNNCKPKVTNDNNQPNT